eukprot:3465111-Lingulodinium_polyedra.AAC.1
MWHARAMLAPVFGGSMARACVPHRAALRWRAARSTASLRSVWHALRDDAVERAMRRFNAA